MKFNITEFNPKLPSASILLELNLEGGDSSLINILVNKIEESGEGPFIEIKEQISDNEENLDSETLEKHIYDSKGFNVGTVISVSEDGFFPLVKSDFTDIAVSDVVEIDGLKFVNCYELDCYVPAKIDGFESIYDGHPAIPTLVEVLGLYSKLKITDNSFSFVKYESKVITNPEMEPTESITLTLDNVDFCDTYALVENEDGHVLQYGLLQSLIGDNLEEILSHLLEKEKSKLLAIYSKDLPFTIRKFEDKSVIYFSYSCYFAEKKIKPFLTVYKDKSTELHINSEDSDFAELITDYCSQYNDLNALAGTMTEYTLDNYYK